MTHRTEITLANLLVTLSIALLIPGAAGAQQATGQARANPAAISDRQPGEADMASFIAELMSRMTLKEKIGQLNLLSSDWDVTGPTLREGYQEDVRAGNVGAIFNAHTAAFTRALQRLAVEETRLGIPLLFGYDVIHGHKTIFPISLGEAASWDLEAIETGSRVAAIEASASGLHWTFAPMVDIARDPRWGRISEGAGEDAYLGSEIAKARVRGFQGENLAAVDTILATAKHYAAYGQAQAGRDYHTTDMSLRELWDTYLPPFRAASEAGVATYMTSFNDLNGVPATANHYLLTEILRNRWRFDGFVVSDYTSVNELVPHGFARDEKHAAELSINAGVDMDMQGATFMKHLPGLVEQGRVDVETIDAAVRRILEMKYRLGLFEDPYRYSNEAREAAAIYADEHLEAARDVARKSIVLLKNERDLLPLRTDISLAVIGPLADSEADMIGSWSAAGEREDRPVTLLEAIRERLGEQAEIHFEKGASYRFEDEGDRSGFEPALAAANRADVIIAAMGERWDMTGEAASRTSLELPGNQVELLKELRKLGKPVVLVLMNGRPLELEWADENIHAILETWYAGTQGGHAIADVLFGDYNPSGRLPVTFPRNVGQVPIYYNMKNTGRPYDAGAAEQKYKSRYLATPNSPLYPFGYGLSYTEFNYSDLALDREAMGEGDSIAVSVRVTNSGDVDGEEVVQLYTRDMVGSVTRPVKELKGFDKISLAAGESRSVEFTLEPSDLAFHRQDMSYGAEAGSFKVFVGGNSEELLEADFRLTEDVSVSDAPL
ncbi:MAG TPA: beta-glucosidase BglX [Woeseiaceae bacterium]|nr:beta-glucosidase BglX [Woeseiaceae bacterium]